jgi:hypothetical protein
MYRVAAIFSGALILSGCAMNLDAFKPAPLVDNVRIESEPPGAQAKSANGQSCVTPCALALPTDAPATVTFTLNGYQPATENLQVVQDTASQPQLRPNPLHVDLAMIPPPPKPIKRAKPKSIATKKTNTEKTAAKPMPKAASTQVSAAPAPVPSLTPGEAAPPPPQQDLAPWPDPPPAQR